MSTTLLQTLTYPAPPVILFRYRRREVILTAAGRPLAMTETLTEIEARPSKAAQWLRHRLDLARFGAVAVAVAVRVVMEDIGAWLRGEL